MVEDILSRCGNVRSIEKSLSSVSLRLTALPDKASPERGGARRRRAEGFVPKRRKVAAALSAAVTTAKLIGDTPTLQAEPSQKKRPNSNASRSSGERGLGGEELLSEKLPLPPVRPPPRSLSGREREGGGLSSERPPPSQAHTFSIFSMMISQGLKRRGALAEFVAPRLTRR